MREEMELVLTKFLLKHSQKHNGPKTLSTLTHSTTLFQSRGFNKLWNLGQTSASLGLHQSSLNKRNWVAYWQGKTMIGLVLFWSTTPLLFCSDNLLRYFNNLDLEIPSSENVTTTGQASSGGKLFDWMSFLKWTPATSGGYLWIK